MNVSANLKMDTVEPSAGIRIGSNLSNAPQTRTQILGVSVRRIISGIVLILCAAILSSCSEGEGSLRYKLMTMLGFDMNDYENEPMKRFVASDEDAYGEILRIISMLTLDSPYVEPFETPKDTAAGNRDAILNYMLNVGYAGYSGNSELLASAVDAYPQYNITTLIPESDFESTVYRNFGGNSNVTHKSSARFTYLPLVNAYTTTGQPATVTVTVDVTSCVETENTYRISFALVDESGLSVPYSAMLMKRDDGTIYMRYLRRNDTTSGDSPQSSPAT